MLKYVSKLAMDILPSVVATIIGAYIVNHYIVTKPGADAPVAAAVSPADPKKADVPSTDVANLPAAGVRARGISEKAIFEKPAAAVKPVEKPQEKSAEKSIEKPVEKSSEPSEGKPAETASIPVETRPHTAAPREKEKTAIRTIPLTAPACSRPSPRRIRHRRLKPPSPRKIIATPMIWPVPRSNGCAAVRRGRRKQPAFRNRPATWQRRKLRLWPSRLQRSGRCRRRSWFRRRRRIRMVQPWDPRRGNLIRIRRVQMIPAVRRLRPIFRSRVRLT